MLPTKELLETSSLTFQISSREVPWYFPSVAFVGLKQDFFDRLRLTLAQNQLGRGVCSDALTYPVVGTKAFTLDYDDWRERLLRKIVCGQVAFVGWSVEEQILRTFVSC